MIGLINKVAKNDFLNLFTGSKIAKMSTSTTTTTECCICYEVHDENRQVTKSISCGHYLHHSCMKKWVVAQNQLRVYQASCPMCRKLVPEFDQPQSRQVRFQPRPQEAHPVQRLTEAQLAVQADLAYHIRRLETEFEFNRNIGMYQYRGRNRSRSRRSRSRSRSPSVEFIRIRRTSRT